MMSHAAYIWWAYGTAAALLVGLLAASLRTLRAREAELEAADDGRGRRRRGAAP
jgi:heme exporter protein D